MAIFKTKISYLLQLSDAQFDDETIIVNGDVSMSIQSSDEMEAAETALKVVLVACSGRGQIVSVRLISEVDNFTTQMAAKQ